MTRLFLLLPLLQMFLIEWGDGWIRAGFGFRALTGLPGWLRMRGERGTSSETNLCWASPKTSNGLGAR